MTYDDDMKQALAMLREGRASLSAELDQFIEYVRHGVTVEGESRAFVTVFTQLHERDARERTEMLLVTAVLRLLQAPSTPAPGA